MADIKASMCTKMEAELDKQIAKLAMLIDIIDDQVDELRAELLSIASKPASQLNDLLDSLNDISDEAESNLPPEEVDNSQLDDIIENCPWAKELYGAYTDAEQALKDEADAAAAAAKKEFNDFTESISGGSGGWVSSINTFGKKVVDTAKEAGDYAADIMNGVGDGITASLDSLKASLPELGVDDLREFIESQLDSLLIDKIKETIDQLIECLSAVCGKDMSSKIDEVNDMLENAGLDVEGKLDMDTLMDDAGLTDDHKENINESTDKMKETRGSAQDSATRSGENYMNNLKNKYL